MNRLTEFNNGVWGMSAKAAEEGYDRYSIFRRLAEYENTGLTPEEITRLHTVIKQQGEELIRRDKLIREPDKEPDSWKRDAIEATSKLGEIRIALNLKTTP